MKTPGASRIGRSTNATTRRDAASAIDFLRRHDGAAAMLPHAERLLNLRRDLLALMPVPLRETCEVSALVDETVTLRVSSASAAAKLRQTLPRLRDGLVDRGWKVSAIRVRVQPRIAPIQSTAWIGPRHGAMPLAAVAAFNALQRDLGESPLRDAVRRLVDRRR